MPVIASALAAIIPISMYLIIIWRFDRFDKEPLGLYLKNFLWGAVGAIILAIIGNFSFSILFSFFIHNHETLNRAETIAIAPVVEEITKGVFLFITVANRKFDNITDGMVYGSAIGLGFGMTENFLYFISYGETFGSWLLLVVIRSLFTAVMHCVSTATFGAFLGYSKFKPITYKITYPIIGLTLAIFIHFAWNFSVSYSQTSFIGIIFLTISIIIYLTAIRISVSNERKLIYKELSEETHSGLIPVDHLEILSSEFREDKGWIDESIRKKYIKAATTLAFRKMQYRNTHGYNKYFYEQEIIMHRELIISILKQ